MKILSITTQKPHSTGSGVYLTELVRSWDRLGIRQAVVAGIYPDDEVHFPEGVSFYPVYYTSRKENTPSPQEASLAAAEFDTAPRISYPVLGMSDVMPYESTLYSSLDDTMADEMLKAFRKAVSTACRELQPNVIFCHHLYLLTAAIPEMIDDIVAEGAMKVRPKVVGLSHGSDLRQFTNTVFRREEVACGIRQLDGILALHEEQADDIARLFGVSREDVAVANSGYNPAIFHRREKSEETASARSLAASNDAAAPITLIYAGKLSREKGLLPFFDALTRMAEGEETPSFRLLLAGGCRDEVIKERLTDEDELRQGPLTKLPFDAEYLGMLSQEELADTFRAGNLFILPSYYEGLPLVLIEAMACGLRIITSALPGVRPWIESKIENSRALYVEPPSFDAPGIPVPSEVPGFSARLEEAVSEALNDCAEEQSGARERVFADTSRATWDGVAKNIIDLI